MWCSGDALFLVRSWCPLAGPHVVEETRDLWVGGGCGVCFIRPLVPFIRDLSS